MKRNKNKLKSPNLILDLRPPEKRPHSKSAKQFTPFRNKRFLYAIIAILLVGLTVWIVSAKNQPEGQKELSKVKASVSKLMILPNDEEPTLAIVDDVNILKDEFLATKAANGDQVLIYEKNGIVIVYRPSSNKIAAVGSVTADPAFPEAKDTSVTVMNGSDDNDKTKKIIEKVKNAYTNLSVKDGGKTNRQDFTTTIVIDNTNKKDNLVAALQTIISAKSGVVPLGEEKTATDLMIIVGKD